MVKLLVLRCLFCFGWYCCFAHQQYDTLQGLVVHANDDNDLLPAAFHQNRRQALRNVMPSNSVALFFSSPVRNRSNDIDFEYHQDPNLYYLTGLREPHALLLIFKEEQDFGDGHYTDELLFLQPTGLDDEIWTGKRMGPQGAKTLLRIRKAMEISSFPKLETNFKAFDHILVFPRKEIVTDVENSDDLYELIQTFDRKMVGIEDKKETKRLPQFMAKLREVKDEEELRLLRKAIDITCDAQIALMEAVMPGMKEYEAEAIVEYYFKKEGAEHPGFPSILGSGKNSCVLHYTKNRSALTKNSLLISDVGAEYHGYTADITRTIPARGSFSDEEKKIYNLVLKAQLAGIEACKKGNKFWEPHNRATEVIANGLLELGIITKRQYVKKYFMHGTSHYLGLDVHDLGLYGPLTPGNVITVEPGIYIPEGSDCDPKWWNIGVRIEDDILITIDEPEVLSRKVPKTVEEIELLMQKDASTINKD